MGLIAVILVLVMVKAGFPPDNELTPGLRTAKRVVSGTLKAMLIFVTGLVIVGLLLVGLCLGGNTNWTR